MPKCLVWEATGHILQIMLTAVFIFIIFRFDVSAVHPKSKTPGTFTQTPYCKKATSSVVSGLAVLPYKAKTQ